MKADTHRTTPQIGLTRRDLVGAAAAIGAAALAPRSAAAADLPGRGEFVIRNAHVLTMDPQLPDVERGDVHVRNGEIVAVGQDVAAPGAMAIDARNMIALPGLTDTHNHLWNSACRNFVMEGPVKGYFPVVYALGQQYTPEDIYRGVRLGCAEMIDSGITTVHDWAHNVRSPEHARAEIRALTDCGIRARFSYGHYHGGPPPDQPMDLTDVASLQKNWQSFSNEGLLTLGWAARVFGPSGLPSVHPMTLETAHRDWDAVRALKLPITAHIGGNIAFLEREGMLGPDLQITGTRGLDGDDFAIIAKTGTHVSVTPNSEMRYNYSLPKLLELLKLNLKVSLADDTAPVAGVNNLFAAMRVLMDTQFVRTRDPMSISARQVLQMATINGAWDMGISDKVGSLTPGKRADLILVRTTDLNMAPLGDPVTAIVRSAQPSNVDTVVIDGRILKRGGRLTALDTEEIVAQATDSLAGVRRRANL
jgi:cytosine/adenosine deaminase-related metal-dependent hydrolase